MPTLKTATARAFIEPETKRQAEDILKRLGLSISNAYELFYRQIIAHNGLPFELRIPNKETIKAMDRARQDKGKRFNNPQELYKELGI